MTLLLSNKRILFKSEYLPRIFLTRHNQSLHTILYPTSSPQSSSNSNNHFPQIRTSTSLNNNNINNTTRKMSTYVAKTSTSPTLVPQSVLKFYENFYATSDSPTSQSDSDYVNAFTPNATLIMGTRKATGSEELMALRKGLWSGPVKTRLHTVEKIYGWDEQGKEIMLFGNVRYGLKNGKEVTVDWAGRAELVLEGESVKMGFYQVYLDSAPVANAMKD